MTFIRLSTGQVLTQGTILKLYDGTLWTVGYGQYISSGTRCSGWYITDGTNYMPADNNVLSKCVIVSAGSSSCPTDRTFTDADYVNLSRSFITVPSIADRDKLFNKLSDIPDGKIVRVNSGESGSTEYYIWDYKSQSWVLSYFGGNVIAENALIKGKLVVGSGKNIESSIYSIISVSSDKLQSTPIVDGQIIFMSDSDAMYYDTDTGRHQVKYFGNEWEIYCDNTDLSNLNTQINSIISASSAIHVSLSIIGSVTFTSTGINIGSGNKDVTLDFKYCDTSNISELPSSFITFNGYSTQALTVRGLSIYRKDMDKPIISVLGGKIHIHSCSLKSNKIALNAISGSCHIAQIHDSELQGTHAVSVNCMAYDISNNIFIPRSYVVTINGKELNPIYNNLAMNS